MLRRKYGIDLDRYNEMLIEQNNSCAICLKPETVREPRNGGTRRLAVDHCHKTGKVRNIVAQGPTSNFLLSLLHMYDIEADSIGDSTGAVPLA